MNIKHLEKSECFFFSQFFQSIHNFLLPFIVDYTQGI